MDAFLNGVVAGYGIAIPVGAIAVLIVEVGMRSGFRCGAFAGAGAATADLLYATAAVVGGAALAGTVESVVTPLTYASGAVLAAVAGTGLLRARGDRRQPTPVTVLPDRSELRATYARFLGLTIINPLTVVYFAAFVVGMGLADGLSAGGGVVFVAGAFLASWSWQLLLAGVGAIAGHALPDRVRLATIVLGNLLVIGLAAVIVLR
jgi:threonine/homoserine/homoserine lactone efflux protein